jgi:hypothetical protein
MRDPALGSPRFADQTMLHLSWMAEAGGRVTPMRDNHFVSTAVCADCGHVRWRHGPQPENPCNVPGCPCRHGWSFYTAVYEGNRNG